MYKSTDNGKTWNSTGPAGLNIQSIIVKGNIIIFSSLNGGVYLSKNNGITWSWENSGLVDLSTTTLIIKGDLIYAGTYGCGIWKRSLNDLLHMM